MSAFFCTLGIFVFYYLLRFIFTNPASISRKQTVKKGQQVKPSIKAAVLFQKIPEIILTGIICFTCLELAFSATFWGTANSVEVYPLHVFFLAVLMLVFLKAILTTVKSATGESKPFIYENKY